MRIKIPISKAAALLDIDDGILGKMIKDFFPNNSDFSYENLKRIFDEKTKSQLIKNNVAKYVYENLISYAKFIELFEFNTELKGWVFRSESNDQLIEKLIPKKQLEENLQLADFLNTEPEQPKSLQEYKDLINNFDFDLDQKVNLLTYSLTTKKIIKLGKIQYSQPDHIPQIKSVYGWVNLSKKKEAIKQAKNILFQSYCSLMQNDYEWSDDELLIRKKEVLKVIKNLKTCGYVSIKP